MKRAAFVRRCHVGLVGLAVMGESLALNLERRGFSVAVFNRTASRVDAFLGNRAAGKKVRGCRSIEELLASLKRPRKILVMVKAGKPVDDVLGELLPRLEPRDVVIDGGNSHYRDTARRVRAAGDRGIYYIGAGISGGEQGALLGPSIMPGGATKGWPLVKPLLQAIAAKAPNGSVCCDWVGPDGAGHFVKMVHNGIEYADMQMIAETYGLMKDGLALSPDKMHAVFARWNRGELESYLIEITRDILAKRDPETGKPLVEVILDAAAQKGTGMWTVRATLELGVPAPVMAEALFARTLSAMKGERTHAAALLSGPGSRRRPDAEEFLGCLRSALYASKICCYAQGFQVMRAASRQYGWNLQPGRIALLWRAGCIIRAKFLDRIREAYSREPDLPNLLLDPYFRTAMAKAQAGWRQVVARSAELGVPAPAFTSALAYYDGYRSEHLPANLLQAQRDYFGAHGYERVDRPRGQTFHTDWQGGGGEKQRG